MTSEPAPENAAQPGEGAPLSCIPRTSVELRLDPAPSRPRVEHFRGAVASLFPEAPLFHQHLGGEAGRLRFRYPRVQYAIDEDRFRLVGLGDEAAARCRDFPWQGTELRIGRTVARVRSALVATDEVTFAAADRLIRYETRSPWLPLNQENHARFDRMAPDERVRELDRLVVAHLLGMMTGLGVHFPVRLLGAFEVRNTVRRRFKGVSLLGFVGRVLTNLDMTDGLAIGKATSHGFGRLTRGAPEEAPSSREGAADARRAAADLRGGPR